MCHYCAGFGLPSSASAWDGPGSGPDPIVGSIAGTKTPEAAADGTLTFALAANAADIAGVRADFAEAYDAIGRYVPLTESATPLFVRDVRSAFARIDDVVEVDFKSAGSFVSADIKLFGAENLRGWDGTDYAGRSEFPDTDPRAGGGYEVFVALNTNGFYNQSDGLGTGSYRHALALHEVSHALGLAHPFDSGNGSGTLAPGDPLDDVRFTVMSYNGNPDTGLGYAVTPMALDVAALQHLYGSGANHEGHTVYRLADPGSAALDADGADGLATVAEAFACIWDTGGRDGIVYGGALSALINLNEATLDPVGSPADVGEWRTDLQGAGAVADALADAARTAGGFLSGLFGADGAALAGGYTIASAAYASADHAAGHEIEDATGGGGADTLIGNTSANTLDGAGGNDLLHGSWGDDGVRAGAGEDVAWGGDGNDHLNGQAGADRLLGGDGADILRGGTEADRMEGGAGADRLDGEAGRDALLGGIGADTLVGGADGDRLDGGDQGDRLLGAAGADTLLGGAGHDTLFGGPGADVAAGQSGRDVFVDVRDGGTLVLADFEVGTDTLDLTAHALDGAWGDYGVDGRHARLAFGADTVVFKGLNLSALDEATILV